MKKFAVTTVVFALSVAVGAFGTPQVLQAQQQGQLGTAAEAKAMLEKAVPAVKADQTRALAMFNNGEGGFKDRDLSILLRQRKRDGRRNPSEEPHRHGCASSQGQDREAVWRRPLPSGANSDCH
jgi:hypothetical protein